MDLGLFTSENHRTEQYLLKCAVAGDAQASKEIIRILSRPAYSLAWKMLGNKEDAEDVVQDAFIRLWKGADSYSGKAKLFTYFYSIVSNLCLDRLKVNKQYAFDEFNESEHQGVGDVMLEIVERVHSEKIRSAMDILNAKQRMAILMWAYQDQTAEQIGVTMGMNKNSVDQLLYRAKLKLKAELEKGGDHEFN